MYQNLSKQSSTHLPVLIKLVQATTGPVAELGSGVFSTPVLHWLCLGRKLVTYENNKEYFDFAYKFRSRKHVTVLLNKWKEVNARKHWSVVFIDLEPSAERGKAAIRQKDTADFVVLHDSENPEQYGYTEVWQHFKYRYDYYHVDASTTVVSNFIDPRSILDPTFVPEKVNTKPKTKATPKVKSKSKLKNKDTPRTKSD